MAARDCPRCGCFRGLILRYEYPESERGCWRCGFHYYPDGAAAARGERMLGQDFADILRSWAKAAGLDWDDRAISVSADGEGASVSVEGEPDFAAKWAAAFDLALADYEG